MPNHVINEVIFESVTPSQVDKILGLTVNQSKEIDFSILLPVPLNYWMGSCGADHQQAFPGTALDWCSKNWSTKWNAYGMHFTHYDGERLTLRFKTAWRAPYGWMCALFNVCKLGFTYRSMSEGESNGRVGTFRMTPESHWSSVEWKEREAIEGERDELGSLLWGVEAWKEICAEQSEA